MSLIMCCGNLLSEEGIILTSGKLSGFLSIASLSNHYNGPLIPTRFILTTFYLNSELQLELFLLLNPLFLLTLLFLPLMLVFCQHFMIAFICSCLLLIFIFHCKAYLVLTASFFSNNPHSSPFQTQTFSSSLSSSTHISQTPLHFHCQSLSTSQACG